MQVFCMWSYVKNNEKILPYLVKKLRRVKLVNKVLATQFLFFRPWIPMWNMKKINRNSNSSFIKLRRWTSPITDVACSRSKCRVSMISKMFISFSFSTCDIKTHINKGYTINKLAMNNRRLLIESEFHFVHPVEKES